MEFGGVGRERVLDSIAFSCTNMVNDVHKLSHSFHRGLLITKKQLEKEMLREHYRKLGDVIHCDSRRFPMTFHHKFPAYEFTRRL